MGADAGTLRVSPRIAAPRTWRRAKECRGQSGEVKIRDAMLRWKVADFNAIYIPWGIIASVGLYLLPSK